MHQHNNEYQHHQTNCHIYLFHRLSTTDCILDVHLTTSGRDHWIASSPFPQQLCSDSKTVSLNDAVLSNLPSPLSLSLFLVCQTLLNEVSRSCCSTSILCWMMPSLVLCSTLCEYKLSPGTLDVSVILVQCSWCWSPWTINDWHLVIPFGFLLSVSGYPRSVSNIASSNILPARFTKFSNFIYYFYFITQ